MADRYLIDTHAWLWWNASPEKLPAAATAVIADGGNEIFLSCASAWEIIIKTALGKLSLPEWPERYVPRRLQSNGIGALPIRLTHVLAVSRLPAIHRDPFDRLLVAQARLEHLVLITGDEAVSQYDVDVLWAR